MELNDSNVKKTLDDIKEDLNFHNVTVDFIDIDYTYISPPSRPDSMLSMGPVIKYKTNDSVMDWYINNKLSEVFPQIVQSVSVS
jgi:hypothetical protein|tara:strand:+ start:247 stop:498 length:252 start_codon:yes stop_codon:yes gene_type:complete